MLVSPGEQPLVEAVGLLALVEGRQSPRSHKVRPAAICLYLVARIHVGAPETTRNHWSCPYVCV